MAVTAAPAGARLDAPPPHRPISRRRKAASFTWYALCSLGLLLLVGPVVWVIAGVIGRAVGGIGWQWSIFTKTAEFNGLANALVGTLILVAGVGIIAGTVGIGGGVFLAEYCPPGRGGTLRRAIEILAGVPSIVFGFVGYVALVVGLHWGLSLLPALLVLSVLVLPYIAKSTELALNQVPLAYREGAEALGISRARILRKIVLRSAMPGVGTGVIVALAISMGETAPLLFTAGWYVGYPHAALIGNGNQFPYLTYLTWSYYNSPLVAQKQLAYDATLILVFLVIALILLSRLVVRLTQKYSPERATAVGRAERKATRERSKAASARA